MAKHKKKKKRGNKKREQKKTPFLLDTTHLVLMHIEEISQHNNGVFFKLQRQSPRVVYFEFFFTEDKKDLLPKKLRQKKTKVES